MAPYGSSGLGGIGELITGVIGALAGLALLAALTAAIVIPLAFFIGRKKRDLSDFSPLFQKKMKEMEILQEYIRSIPDVENQPYKLMSNYLSCTGLLNKKNRCLERISCEGGHPNGNFTSVEAGAISM